MQSTSLSDVNVDSWKVELGADQMVSTRSDGATLVVGVLGGYVDGRAQFSWFDSKLKSSVLGKLDDSNDGTGQAYG